MAHERTPQQTPTATEPGIFTALAQAIEDAEAELGKPAITAPLAGDELAAFTKWYGALANNERVLRELRGVKVDDRDALCKRISDWIMQGQRDPEFLRKNPSLVAYCRPLLTHFATQAKHASAARRVVSTAVNPFGIPIGD